MTQSERAKVWLAGKNAGAKQSKLNPFNQVIPQTGGMIKHIGTNRTIVSNKVYYGANAAINAINKLNG